MDHAQIDSGAGGDPYSSGCAAWGRGDLFGALGYFTHAIPAAGVEQRRHMAALSGGIFRKTRLAEGKNPVVSGSGKHAAYFSEDTKGLTVIAGDGASRHCIVSDMPCAPECLFSPDENHLVYVAAEDSSSSLYAAGVRGSDRALLLKTEGRAQGLVFSGNGKYLAFTRYAAEGCAVELVGMASHAALALPQVRKYTHSPVFSPDGGKVIFLAQDEWGRGQAQVFIVVVDLEKMTAPLLLGTHGAQCPVCCSPDGRCVVASSPAGLRLFSLEGNVSRELTSCGQDQLHQSPVFLPDARLVAFLAGAYNCDEVRLVDVHSAQTRCIYKSRIPLSGVAYLPLLGRLLCIGRQGRVSNRLFLLDLNGKEAPLLNTELSCGNRDTEGFRNFSVSSSGNRIVYERELNGAEREYNEIVALDLDPGTPVQEDELVARMQTLSAQERYCASRRSAACLGFDPLLRTLAGTVSPDRLEEHVRILQGFGPRHVGSVACAEAGAYLYDQLAGYGLEVAYDAFGYGSEQPLMLRNVVATLPGKRNPKSVYVICAHYDTLECSPGAWDNASGIAVVLEAARILSSSQAGATIKFICFSGEEIKSVGSKHFADAAKSGGMAIRGVLNNDCVGYQGTSDMRTSLFTTYAPLGNLLRAVADRYSGLITHVSAVPQYNDSYIFNKYFNNVAAAVQDYPYLPNARMHSPGDTALSLSLSYLAEIVKLNVLSLVRMASAPSPVRGLVFRRDAQCGSLSLSWQSNEGEQVAGYRLYHGRYPDIFSNVVDVRGATEYSWQGLPASPAYFVSVRAYDEDGHESWGDEEIEVGRVSA